MTSLTLVADASDGYLEAGHPSWATVRDTTTAGPSSGSGIIPLQASFHDSNYYLGEGFLAFDASAIPAGSTVDSATLSMYLSTDSTNEDIVLEAAAYDWGASVGTTDWRDSAATASLTVLATLSSAGISTGRRTFSDAGPGLASAVVPGAVTRLAIWPRNVRTGVAPTDWGLLIFAASEDADADKRPWLAVEYTEPSGGSGHVRLGGRTGIRIHRAGSRDPIVI